jgi:hypothetical protein
MFIDTFTEEESGNKKLIPQGTLVACKIETDGARNKDGKTSMMWKLNVKFGEYFGCQIVDFLNLAGDYKEYAITKGKNAMMYALDLNNNAHESWPDPAPYQKFDTKKFNGMEVIAKIGVVADSLIDKETGQVKHFLKNVIESYATPRETSSSHGIYKAYMAGEQPWQTDKLPLLPQLAHSQAKQNGYQNQGNINDSEIPF